jgi:transcriptional regulator with XRE-family HTH domain
MSQNELAAKMGVPQTTLGHWERSGKLPGRTIIINMAKTLGVSVEELLRVDKQEN